MAYCAKKNAELALVLNIESQAAIDNLDEILAVPDIDCLLIGPHDLSCNLGVRAWVAGGPPADKQTDSVQYVMVDAPTPAHTGMK